MAPAARQHRLKFQGASRRPSKEALLPAELAGSSMMMFTRTCDATRKLALMLRNLGFGAIPIHGQMSQPKRLAALNKFKVGRRGGGRTRLPACPPARLPARLPACPPACQPASGCRRMSAPRQPPLPHQVAPPSPCCCAALRRRRASAASWWGRTWPRAGWTSPAWTSCSTTTCPPTARTMCTAWGAPRARGARAARSPLSRSEQSQKISWAKKEKQKSWEAGAKDFAGGPTPDA